MNLSRSTKAPDSETDAPKFTKTLSFTDGNRFLQPSQQQQLQPMMVVYYYKECLKNHAASIGGYSLDGCGEFMPAPNANPSDPSSLKCAACGCHRNFHRREPDDNLTTTTTTTHFLNFHQRLPMSSSSPSLSPKSPQPVQQAYYTAAAPHMLLALGSGGSGGVPDQQHQEGKRKRFRTKFSREQKERMCVLADKLGWKMQKSEEKLVEEFCKDVGVPRRVFKVWMHNNKNLVKRANYHVAAAHDDDSININVDGDCKREDSEANVGGGDNDNAVHAGSSSSSYERN